MMAESGPYFAIDGYDVSMFTSQREAASWLEAIDVENGAYRFFVADGTELRLSTAGNVVLVTDEKMGKYPDFLVVHVRHYLLSTNSAKRGKLDATALEQASLGELVTAFCKVVGTA